MLPLWFSHHFQQRGPSASSISVTISRLFLTPDIRSERSEIVRQTGLTRFDMSVPGYCLPSGLENFVGKPIPTYSPRKHYRSHHCCDCARGDLTSCVRRLIRKLTSNYFDHGCELVRKRATSFLCGAPNIGCQSWEYAAMRLIVTMTGTQISRHNGIKAFLDRDFPRKLAPARSRSLHCRRERLLYQSLSRCKVRIEATVRQPGELH